MFSALERVGMADRAGSRVSELSLSDSILVMAAGRIVFAGAPERLSDSAAGRTWVQPDQPIGARAHWLRANGWYRCLGDAAPGATLVEPSLEDGYLLLQQPIQGAASGHHE